MDSRSFPVRALRLTAITLLLSCATLPACGSTDWLLHGDTASDSQPASQPATPGIVKIGEAIAPVLPPPFGGLVGLALPLLGAILTSGAKPKDKHS